MKVFAWLIELTDTTYAAVGEFELAHILPDAPVLFDIPHTPAHCQQVFVWQNKIIPVMNMTARLTKTINNTNQLVGIFAYRTDSGRIDYGALLLNAMPRRLEVSDEQACDLPAYLQAWKPYVRSCFQDTENHVIPILNLERIFAAQAFH